jgi:hypothetical protein
MPTFLAGGRVIDGTLSRDPGNSGDTDVLRSGLMMGKVTASGKYRPSVIGVSTAAYVDNDTTIAVSEATATEISRLKTLGGGGNLSLKFIGPPTAGGTVAATAITVTAVTVNGASSTITVGDLNLNKVAGSFITPADGSETPITFIPDGWGLKVTDNNGASLSDVEFPQVPVAGVIDASQLINWPSDSSLQTWVKQGLNGAGGGQFVFDDGY